MRPSAVVIIHRVDAETQAIQTLKRAPICVELLDQRGEPFNRKALGSLGWVDLVLQGQNGAKLA